MLSSLKAFIYKFGSGQPPGSQENPLQIEAVPGLMTLLDVGLYRAVEGELSGTITSGHALLAAFLDVKRQAIQVLQELRYSGDSDLAMSARSQQLESFARACLDAACDAIEKLSTDKLAQSANLTDPFEHNSASFSTTSMSGQQINATAASLQDSSLDTARRRPIQQRPRDCWESPRLHLPDFVWAEDHVLNNSHRLLRNLLKHPFCVELTDGNLSLSVDDLSRVHLAASIERQASVLVQLVQYDVPSRLLQFRTAIEADSVVLKRLYLVKCEYRAPFRAFLEGHQSVLRAPSVDLVQEYIGLSRSKTMKRRAAAKEQLTEELGNPDLVEALSLEQRCEEFEIDMAKQLFGFCELARFLEHKRARLKAIPGIINEDELQDYHELLRRLKGLLCRKASVETTTGIRPLLLDLQGVPRDEEAGIRLDKLDADNEVHYRIDALVNDLSVLGRLCETRHAFRTEQRRTELDLPSSVYKSCTEFDDELFKCRFQDWYSMVQRQHEIIGATDFHLLAEQLRIAEMQMSLSMAPADSLEVVRQRVEMISADREKRFEILKELVEDICLREMALFVSVVAPEKKKPLALNSTSAIGVFGLPLKLAGESLPIG
ncbi:hypothetical protein MPSEU_000712800 [Mayamaea pseudoterrestris]|nr:hypothetical protein MPSEU_000712800 [Mayamaea pseudoterrestris]